VAKLSQTSSPNKPASKKHAEPSVKAMSAAAGYRRPRSTYSNWAWAPKRPEVKA
jgi:hypothetical protein